MTGKTLRTIAFSTIALVAVLGMARHANAQQTKTPYPNMAALEQYLMADRNEEIALARSAAPESISSDAEVLVLGRHAYETALKGKNGFVCIVQRSWTAPSDDPDFWNPKLRAPICFNAPAARSYLPLTLKKTELVLAGRTKAQMVEAIGAALDKKELPALEPNAMCYMLSKLRIPGRCLWELASAPDVFHSPRRGRELGRGPAGLAGSFRPGRGGPLDRVHDSRRALVGRDGGRQGGALRFE